MRPTLLYDGNCRLCRFVARAVVRADREDALRVLPFADPEAGPLLEHLPAGERLTSWHLVHADGGHASRGHGIADLAAQLRLTRRLAPVLRVLPLDGLYDLVARHRRRLGRYVPDGGAPRKP